MMTVFKDGIVLGGRVFGVDLQEDDRFLKDLFSLRYVYDSNNESS
jgi:hypothetical protein